MIGIALSAGLGALAVLDAERGAAGAKIENFGTAVWWAFTTMSTVGYGAAYPVTVEGRMVAIGMMVVGVSILGVVSAGLASLLLVRIRGQEETATDRILKELAALRAEVAELRGVQGPSAGSALPSPAVAVPSADVGRQPDIGRNGI